MLDRSLTHLLDEASNVNPPAPAIRPPIPRGITSADSRADPDSLRCRLQTWPPADRIRLFGDLFASPDLLESLRALLPYAIETCDKGPYGEGWKSPELEAKIAAAQAAIAKATASA